MGLIKKEGKRPDFKGDGVAVWVNQDKNGNDYLSVKILNAFAVNVFKNDKEEKEKEDVNK